MANIKVDEVSYFQFLSVVSKYLENPDEIKQQQIQHYIDKEFDMRDLMLQRKMYYEFYVKNKDTNEQEAAKAYKKYLDIKERLEQKVR